MRIYPMKIDKYLYLSDLVEQLLKYDVFNIFKEDDVFFITDGKNEKAFSVLRSENGNPFGISFFIGKDGLNTAHDMFCVSNLMAFSPLDYYLTNLMLINKSDLMPKEIDFLKKNNIKIKKHNNVILKSFVPGLEPYISNSKDADMVIEAILCFLLLLKNDLEVLNGGFSDRLSAVMKINYKKHVYSLNMMPLPYLERKYDNKSFLEEEIAEFNGIEYKENEASIIFKHVEIPVKTRGSNVNIYPLFVFYFMDGQMKECEILAYNPSEYRSGIINISKEFFTKYGIPKNLVINNRKLYSALYSLFDRLNIELKLQIENEFIDELVNNICHSTSQMAYGSPIFDENIGAILEENVIEFFEFIKNTINFTANHSLDEILNSPGFEDLNADDYDIEAEEDLFESEEEYVS